MLNKVVNDFSFSFSSNEEFFEPSAECYMNSSLSAFWYMICLGKTDRSFAIWTVSQGIFSRTEKFDGNLFRILTVEDMALQLKPPGLWLNVQVIGVNYKLHHSLQWCLLSIQSGCFSNISHCFIYLFFCTLL